MTDDPSAAIEIVEQHGSFLLIRSGCRFGVVERRAGRLYPMAPGGREGAPITGEEMARLTAEQDGPREDEARQLFKELCERGDRLAQLLR
jgi:hypothetical protein